MVCVRQPHAPQQPRPSSNFNTLLSILFPTCMLSCSIVLTQALASSQGQVRRKKNANDSNLMSYTKSCRMSRRSFVSNQKERRADDYSTIVQPTWYFILSKFWHSSDTTVAARFRMASMRCSIGFFRLPHFSLAAMETSFVNPRSS